MSMQKEVDDLAAIMADKLDHMIALQCGGGLDLGDGLVYDDLVDYLGENALEMYANARLTGSESTPDVREVVVVFGAGGPHVELVVGWNGWAFGRAYWGADRAELSLGFAGGLFEYLVESMGLEIW